MRSTQIHNIDVKELEATWICADNTPRVDVPRMKKSIRSISAHDKQSNIVNNAKRYRAARKTKLAAQVV
jgi:hypothetical protein